MKKILIAVLVLLTIGVVSAAECTLSECSPYTTADARSSPYAGSSTSRCDYSTTSPALSSTCMTAPPADERWQFRDIDCTNSHSPDCVRDCLACNSTAGQCDRIIYGDGSQDVCNNDCECPQRGFEDEQPEVIPEFSNTAMILLVFVSLVVTAVFIKKR